MKMAAVTCPVSTSNAVTGIQMSAVPITGTNEATSVAIPRKTGRGTWPSANPIVARTACTTAVSAAPTSVALETLANSCRSSSVWAACKGEIRPSRRMRCRPSTSRKKKAASMMNALASAPTEAPSSAGPATCA